MAVVTRGSSARCQDQIDGQQFHGDPRKTSIEHVTIGDPVA